AGRVTTSCPLPSPRPGVPARRAQGPAGTGELSSRHLPTSRSVGGSLLQGGIDGFVRSLERPRSGGGTARGAPQGLRPEGRWSKRWAPPVEAGVEMLLVAFFGLCVLSVPLAGGRLTELAHLRLRALWSLLLAAALQLAILWFHPLGQPLVQGGLHMASY